MTASQETSRETSQVHVFRVIQAFLRKVWVLQRPTHATRYVFNLKGPAPIAIVSLVQPRRLYDNTYSEHLRELAVSMLSLIHPTTTLPSPAHGSHVRSGHTLPVVSLVSITGSTMHVFTGMRLCGGTQHWPPDCAADNPCPSKTSSCPKAPTLSCSTTCYTRRATHRTYSSVAR